MLLSWNSLSAFHIGPRVFEPVIANYCAYLCDFCLHAHFLLLPKLWWWWQWWDYGVSVLSFSTVSPHGLLPPLSFYSLLLGDASLSPNVTQAKTPLSSFARARYPGNTTIPPLLFYTHLLSSHIPLPTFNPHLLNWTQNLFLEYGHGGDMRVGVLPCVSSMTSSAWCVSELL